MNRFKLWAWFLLFHQFPPLTTASQNFQDLDYLDQEGKNFRVPIFFFTQFMLFRDE